MDVSALILAAGSATRMGAPKQLLRLGEKTLLEHTLENVRASAVTETVLVLGAAAAEIQRQLSLGGLTVVVNEAYRSGMASSLQKGIAAIHSNAAAVLIVLADQPFVRAATLDALIAEYRLHQAKIVIPLYQGSRGNPVLLDRSLFPEIAALKGDAGCRAIFGNYRAQILEVPLDDPAILLDADVPDDLEKLRQWWALQGSNL